MTRRAAIVITAGGTVEPIDDVRAITNFSGGGVGLALAKEALSRGHEVELFLGRMVRGAPPEGARLVPFGSAEDLAARLLPRLRTLAAAQGVVVFHAAAVADYAPIMVPGKIPSDRDELTLTLRRTPKIVDQIKPAGLEGLTLVSFKLLSQRDGRDVREVARAQLSRTRSDLVVANYIEEVREGYHGWVIPARGEEREVFSRAELSQVALDAALAVPP